MKYKALVIILTCLFMPLKGFTHSAHCEDTKLNRLMEDMKFQLKAYTEAFKQDDTKLMQESLLKLEEYTIKSKDYIPLKILNNMDSNTTTIMDLTEIQLEDFKNYEHEINRLLTYIERLKRTSDKSTIKSTLKTIKKHSKKSHKLFLKDCH
ncbi:hypothetical protein [Vibrio sp. Of7-15]|uniref:hypothetical protein n=1 Tax=Vibrio sp. Of7-15 TaxID=2724879 RepID=UPI001EF29800|nr:hypothetical protein [Vibrio sp. Of7-15]